MSGEHGGQVVVLRRTWHRSDRHRASYRLADLLGVRWDSRGGGFDARHARRRGWVRLFAYVRCDGALAGRVAHSCRHGAPPHLLKCVVLEGDNEPGVYARLAGLAGAGPCVGGQDGGVVRQSNGGSA